MPSLSLAEFVEELQREGELARVGAEVDAEFEAAEITRRVSQQQGPALLFERVRGQRWPVVTNLLGTERRICLALGIDALEQIDERLGRLPSTTDSGGWLGRLRGTAASAQGARRVKTGACQQVVRLGSDIDLADLPAARLAGRVASLYYGG